MFSGYLDNFDMFKHSDVKLVFDNQEILPQVIDFDFTINSSLNGKLTASVNVYNLTIDKLNHLKIACNNTVPFEAKGIDITDLSAKTNENTVVYSISASYSNIKVPNILTKGNTIWYEVDVKGKKEKVFTKLTVTKDYIFSPEDTEEAKLKIVLFNEEKGFFAINNNELLLDDVNTIKLTNIDLKELLLLQALESFAGEELTLISLYSPFLKAGKTLTYSPKNSKTPKNYSIISVTTSYSFASGLIQTVQAKTGSRLAYFKQHGDKKEGGK